MTLYRRLQCENLLNQQPLSPKLLYGLHHDLYEDADASQNGKENNHTNSNHAGLNKFETKNGIAANMSFLGKRTSVS